jgi:hypothetical protein
MKPFYKNINMKITDGPEYRRADELPGFLPLAVKAVLTDNDGLKLYKGYIYFSLAKMDPSCLLEKGAEYAVNIVVDGGKVFLTKVYPSEGGL